MDPEVAVIGGPDAAMRFAEFAGYLSDVLDVAHVRESDSLEFDIGLDSIGMVELMFALEDLDVCVEEDEMLQLRTVGDVYRRYCDGTTDSS